MLYNLSQNICINIGSVLDQSNIRGVDAAKAVALYKILGDKNIKDDNYEISDDLKKFLLNTIKEVTIKGRFAFAILEIQVALSKKVIKSTKAPLPPKSKISKKSRKKP